LETRSLVRIALFAAVIAVLGLLPKFDVPLAGGVPITAQSLGVMLAGLMLGPRDGALSVLLLLFVVGLGAPLLAGGRGGLGVFLGPSVGFLLGWAPGAWVCGFVMRRLCRIPVLPAAIAAALAGGILVVYAFGVPVLAWKADLTLWQALAASAAFLPGDILKAVVAGLVCQAAGRGAPSLLAGRA
jgi:biotin transport system substrate-specific component